jgi:hypothetical protein
MVEKKMATINGFSECSGYRSVLVLGAKAALTLVLVGRKPLAMESRQWRCILWQGIEKG